MYTDLVVSGYNNQQIAYSIGPNKDSYYLNSRFIEIIDTEELSVTHYVAKGPFSTDKLFIGTSKECLAYIKAIVDEQSK